MMSVDLADIFRNHPDTSFTDLECWLLDNIGPGGRWLTGPIVGPDVQVEPEHGDSWGMYQSHNRLYVSIVGLEHALLFQLRWL